MYLDINIEFDGKEIHVYREDRGHSIIVSDREGDEITNLYSKNDLELIEKIAVAEMIIYNKFHNQDHTTEGYEQPFLLRGTTYLGHVD